MTNWSPKQEAVYEAVEHSTDHLVVVARAGAGKTTTAIEACRRIPAQRRVLMCAFNTSIAKALEARAPKHVDVRTLHSYGFGLLKRQWPNAQLDKRRARRLLEQSLRRRPNADTVSLYSLAKARLYKASSHSAALERAAYRVDPSIPAARIAEGIFDAMDAAREYDGTYDFDDMIYVPVTMGWAGRPFDVVFVDETQDMNAGQLALARSAIGSSGRLIVIGDPRQAIYGWRGADVGFMERIERELGARVLPLNITYRCPRAVVRLAQQVVPDFEVADDAPEGEVLVVEQHRVQWREGDAVLSRTNAPLIGHALAALRNGTRARIQGKDIGTGLSIWIESFNEGLVNPLLAKARAWTEREQIRLISAGDDEQVEVLLDRMQTLEALTEGCTHVTEVLGRLRLLFSDDEGPGLVFSSVHRAKGLEWKRVFLLVQTFRPDRNEEEENIWYVAVTRAMQTLVLVQPTGWYGDRRDSIVLDAIAMAEAGDLDEGDEVWEEDDRSLGIERFFGDGADE